MKRRPVAEVRVTVFGRRADTLSQHLTRGMRVSCDGRLEARLWMDRTNSPRAGLEIVAGDIEFSGVRREDDDRAELRGSVVGERPWPEARVDDGDDLENLPF